MLMLCHKSSLRIRLEKIVETTATCHSLLSLKIELNTTPSAQEAETVVVGPTGQLVFQLLNLNCLFIQFAEAWFAALSNLLNTLIMSKILFGIFKKLYSLVLV